MSVSPPRPETDVDLSGRKLGDYQILRRLGRGGMAEVYLAEQASLQRQVAFKVLKAGLASDEAYVRRFRNEALAAAKLSHASIVQIYEVNCVGGVHFIAQEYVKGQNLKQLLTRNRSVDARLAISVMRQVAAALYRAGQKGVIHRDIKPENIMLSSNGEVKVADFGLARVLQDGDAMNLTQVGITMGTPLYMSPEQVEGKGVDQRSDLYSFGVTCYHMLAGRPPFEGEEALSIAVQHLKTEPERLEDLRPDLLPGLCRIVHKLMAKDPQDRFQTGAELLRELRTLQPASEDDEAWAAEALAWIDHELSTATGPEDAATKQLQTLMQTAALKRQAAWRRWTWVAAAFFGALAAGVAFAWTTGPRPLLEVDKSLALSVPDQGSVEAQLLSARMAKQQSPELYEAVWKLYPPDEGDNRYKRLHYSRLAKQYLAKYYRDQKNYEAASQLYTELIDDAKDDGEWFKIVGYFGLANIANARKDVAAVRKDDATARKDEADAKKEDENAKKEADAVQANLIQAAYLFAQIEDQLTNDRHNSLMSNLDSQLRLELQKTVYYLKQDFLQNETGEDTG